MNKSSTEKYVFNNAKSDNNLLFKPEQWGTGIFFYLQLKSCIVDSLFSSGMLWSWPVSTAERNTEIFMHF